jgi:hypothetical protein
MFSSDSVALPRIVTIYPAGRGPSETEPPLPERAVFHSALFGWHSV